MDLAYFQGCFYNYISLKNNGKVRFKNILKIFFGKGWWKFKVWVSFHQKHKMQKLSIYFNADCYIYGLSRDLSYMQFLRSLMQQSDFMCGLSWTEYIRYLWFNNPWSDKLKEGKDSKERKQEIREQGMSKEQQERASKRYTEIHLSSHSLLITSWVCPQTESLAKTWWALPSSGSNIRAITCCCPQNEEKTHLFLHCWSGKIHFCLYCCVGSARKLKFSSDLNFTRMLYIWEMSIHWWRL